jgi:outer membrane protein assembly factor BamB
MRNRNGRAGLILVLALFLIGSPVQALVPALTSLQKILQQSTYIVTAKVESVDAAKPEMVLVVDDDLKGKAPQRKLAIPLKGDVEAKKKDHVPQILKRVAPKLPLVLFIIRQDKKYTALAYTNGTWFQFLGVESDGTVSWRFTHGEPYLRKTFKGSTAELKQTVVDGLAGKKDPPKPDTKEKPGFGPEVPAEKKSEKRGPPSGSTLFAVIPTVFVSGPLAILAMLFPAVFGGSMLVLRRWMAALSVLSLNSALYLLYSWFGHRLASSWWGTPPALWLTMTVVNVLGFLWAWKRHVASLAAEYRWLPNSAGETPARKAEVGWSEIITLGILGTVCLAAAVVPLRYTLSYLHHHHQPEQEKGAVAFSLLRLLAQLPLHGKMLLMFSAGLWVAMLHTLYRRDKAGRRATSKPGLPGEGVLLGTMLLIAVGLSATLRNPLTGAGGTDDPRGLAGSSGRYRVAWRFQPPPVEHCWMASSPWVDGERVYIGAVLPPAFDSSGAVYCVERKTGQEIWMFNDGGDMKPVFSSPCLAGGRVYIGEGFHKDAECKLYCLDAANGKKLWDFTTTSHTESTPCVASGKVYFGAGDDGLYCLDAATGAKIWHREGLHVDANPLVIDNRLYGGSGVGDVYKDPMLFCLNADTGEIHWRMPVDLPVWGMPAVHGEYLFAGIGNGNFLVSADQGENPQKPAGALLCLERATGKRVWRYDVLDGILVRPCADDKHVWFAARDRHCYCLDRRNGTLHWKTDLGSPIVASPSLVGHGDNVGLYVASSQGRVSRLHPTKGKIEWTFDVSKDAEQPATVFSSPLIQVKGGRWGESRWIWFGCGLNEFTRGILYCLEENAVEKNQP